MEPENIAEAWRPRAGLGGLMLSFGILVSLISRDLLTKDAAHGILDEQAAVLEDLRAFAGYDPTENAHISSGLQDLIYLRQMLQQHPLTCLPD